MVFYIFFSNFNRTFFKQTVETLISSVASDLGLHRLPMSHKKDAIGIYGSNGASILLYDLLSTLKSMLD